MQTKNIIRENAGKILLVFFAILSLIITWWASGQSRIKIINPTANPVEVILTDNNNQTEKLLTLQDTDTYSLKKGSHKLLAEATDGSFFSIVSTKGFFRTTEVTLNLDQGHEVNFIGTNPGNCGFFNSIYVSYDCGSSTDSIKAHRADTADSPSYSFRNPENVGVGDLGNVFTIGTKRYVIIQESNQKKVGRNVLYEVVNDSGSVSLIFIKSLDSLKSDSLYFAEPYKTGFIAYTKSPDDMYYYDSLTKQSEATYLGEYSNITDESLTSLELSSQKDTLVVTLSNSQQFNKGSGKSEVKITTGDEVLGLIFNSNLINTKLCGKNLLCALSDGVFTVFNIDKGGEKLYSVVGVTNFSVSLNQTDVFLGVDSRIISFNPDERTGFVLTHHENMEFNSIQTLNDGTIQVQLSSVLSTNAVLISDKKSSENSIYALISNLEKSGLVDGVSPYKKRVFITPRLGEVVYDEQTGYFDYNPVVKASVNGAINKIISESSVDTSQYEIINVLN